MAIITTTSGKQKATSQRLKVRPSTATQIRKKLRLKKADSYKIHKLLGAVKTSW